MGKRRTHPTGDRKFHAPKAKRILREAPGAAGSALPLPPQSDPKEDPAGMEPQASKNSSSEVDPDRILVAEDGPRSPQEGRDKEIGRSRALGSPKQGISKGMEENHLELPQLGILEADGTGKNELESPKPGILDGAGENCPESPKLAILEVDGKEEEPPESTELEILDGMGQNHLESSQLGTLEANGAGEEQLEPPQLRIPEADGAGEQPPESVKLEILDGTGEEQLESSKPGILEVVEAAEEQLETPTHRISDGAGEEHPESVKPGVSEAAGEREEQLELMKQGVWDGAGEEQLELLKQGVWDGAGEEQLESPEGGGSGAQGSSPEHTVTDTVTDTEVLQAGEGGALEQGRGTGTALSVGTGCPDHPRDPESHGGDTESRSSPRGSSSVATAALDPRREQREGAGPELPVEKPWHTAGQIHTGSTGNSPAQPWESARAAEPADASDIIHGLIRELSDLNRLAMGARRGLELLRRPKPRRGRRPAPSGTHWKEG